MLRDILLQICQVLAVLTFAPLLQGIIQQFEERVQLAQGPGIFQPYRDLWKLFHKQIVVPETASWIYWVAPFVAFTAMLTVPILIPVLTDFPLPLSDMGDILGGGLILTLGSFMIVLAGLDSGSAYGGIGSSRAVMVAILAEPTLILVFVGITLLAKAMLPFVVNHLLVGSPAVYFSPAHLFLILAFFTLLIVETDRLPIHSSTHIEVYMIEEARILEYSGPLLAILRWASMMKQFILYTIFCNVLLIPWGLSREGTAIGVIGSVASLMAANFWSSPSPWWSSKPRSRACASTDTRNCSRPRSSSPSSPLSERNWCNHAGRASRSARLIALQPDGDRELAARLRDARLALAQQLSLCLRRRILGHRRAFGGGRILRRLSRTLSDCRSSPRCFAACSCPTWCGASSGDSMSRAKSTKFCSRARRSSSARCA